MNSSSKRISNLNTKTDLALQEPRPTQARWLLESKTGNWTEEAQCNGILLNKIHEKKQKKEAEYVMNET